MHAGNSCAEARVNHELRQELQGPGGPLGGREVVDVVPISGGCIHQAWRVQLCDGSNVFVKSGPPEAMALFEVEADALNALHGYANAELLVVPQPLAVASLSHDAVLVLPWMELRGGDQARLGQGLALLHQSSAATGPGRYGWTRDGFIGAGPQPGGWRDAWGDAFVELRLLPQLKLLNGLGLEQPELTRLLSALAQRLNHLDVAPSLVHGDLWGGNAATLTDGRGSLFDPASWWADREVDLAMTHLFGGFSQSFYREYQKVLPSRPGASERIEIYNLYHLLNHANLFGGGYLKQSLASLQQLARLLIN